MLTIKYNINYNLIGFEKNLLHDIIRLLFTSKVLGLYTCNNNLEPQNNSDPMQSESDYSDFHMYTVTL